ncbi:MAG: GC-type dockerin domain-anchored protein [bacterium]
MSWSALGTGIDGTVSALAVMPNGDLLAGGAFTTAGGVQANSIARWNGLSWSALGAGIEGGVNALAVLPVSGSIVAGGFIATAGGLPVNYVARWDGSSWSPLGVGTNRLVLALTSVRTPGGGEDLYAGGFFTTAGGVPATYIARWNGTAWSALGTGTSYIVTSLAALPDGAGGASVIAAGPFGGAGGGAVWGVGRWDGSAWFALGGYTDQLINAISVRADGAGGGDLYVAGDLAEAGNMLYEPDPVQKIAQYRFGKGLPRVTAQPVGGSRCTGGEATLEVLTGGSGSTLSYQWRKGGVPIDTTVNPSAAWARLAISNLRSADAGSYDCVISNACGSTTSTLAVLSVGSCGCGLSDIAGPGQSIGADGSLTADDIIVFLNWFFAGDWRGDVAGAGQSSVPDGQFSADDIIVFLNRFFAGCS